MLKNTLIFFWIGLVERESVEKKSLQSERNCNFNKQPDLQK